MNKEEKIGNLTIRLGSLIGRKTVKFLSNFLGKTSDVCKLGSVGLSNLVNPKVEEKPTDETK